MAGIVKYPLGQQDFRILREMGYVYVDKTGYIEKIINGGQYVFLSRPRRFGKSLFLSTLQYFFEGERELFKGLYIDTIGWNWEPYPVLRLDLNTDRYVDAGMLDSVLDTVFNSWEKKYGVENPVEAYSQRLKNIIEAAHVKTGHRVVILVDEYDKPLAGNLNEMDKFEHYRAKLASIYSNFKSSAEHIRLVFLTGVSRFGKLSIFSDLNNISDITFDRDFADICGITEKEMLATFQTGISEIARKEGISYEEALARLKKNYDGYRFAEGGSDIYNPWSLLSCLAKSRIANYWNDTGMPKLVAESLKRVNADLKATFDTYCTEDDLKGLDLMSPDPTALLYQTGYLTIKEYNVKLRRLRLGIPNDEVKEGLFKVLLPYYVKSHVGTENKVVSDMVMNFMLGDAEGAMKCMQAYFAGISHKMKMDNENNFHNAFYLLTDLIGLETETESATSDGNIDIVIRTADYIYVIELKYDRSAASALKQIEKKHYARKYQADKREIIMIGVSFSSETRCIENWVIRRSKEGIQDRSNKKT